MKEAFGGSKDRYQSGDRMIMSNWAGGARHRSERCPGRLPAAGALDSRERREAPIPSNDGRFKKRERRDSNPRPPA